MDEFVVAQVETDVGDSTFAKEDEVADLEIFSFDGAEGFAFDLLTGVARDKDTHLFKEHLHEARAVDAEGGGAAPIVGEPHELFAEGDDLGKGFCGGCKVDIP